MLKKRKHEFYIISFTLEEIRPLIIRNIDRAQDPTEHISLSNITIFKGSYNYYHEQLKDYYLQIGKKIKPSMSDKLAYLILLSYSKRKILLSETIEDFKLFGEKRECDFNIIKWDDDHHHEENNDCICSYQNLKTVWYVENIHTGIVLRVGSECIQKYKLVSKEEFEHNKKILKKITSKKKRETIRTRKRTTIRIL